VTTAFTLRNCHTQAVVLGGKVRRFGQRLGLSARQINALNLALEEVFTNIVSYAYPQGGEHLIRLRLAGNFDQITMRIEDDGIAFDPLSVPPADVSCQLEGEKVGGLGIHLARHLVDQMVYRRLDQRNILTMTMRVTACPHA
jgi:anti-sigma regulatory factor (Ser/Thr protein kinase)